ncbi:MAG: STN and carboxypeptidase regulatory-like domain-containing protein [Bacteroidetes bacterium]|nr:STN and carboxypeptidase regulatory-like domain-containing protein [Bacteroidota bacterium]
MHSFIYAFIFAAFFFLFPDKPAFSQVQLLEKSISIPRQNTTLYEALNLISQRADCLFLYNSETVESDKKVKLHAENETLKKVLDNLLSDPRLNFKVLGKHILIYRTNKDTAVVIQIASDIQVKDTGKPIMVRGHIYDRENKSAIPFAAIGITEENIGTITNNEGFFTLKLPAKMIGTSLLVSHLGYMSQRIPVQLLNRQQVDLYLDRRVISIQEVIIRYLDPKVIIEKAMEQRKANYSLEPVYLTAFYREGVRKNTKYISYSEAVFKIYKSAVTSGEYSDQVKLLKSRKVQDINPRDTVFLKLKAGVQSALQLDIIKNIPGFLDLIPPVEYTYKYSNLVSYNTKDAYAITFVQKADLRKALYSGTFYIEKESFALLGADFEINPAYLELAAEDLVLKKSSRLIVKLEKITYSISYMPFNGKYYLNHVRCEIQLKTRLKNHLFSDNFNTFLELASCSIDTAAVKKFPKQELLKPNAVFSDQPYSADDAFWGDFNTITPEAKLSEALSRIIGKIEKIE